MDKARKTNDVRRKSGSGRTHRAASALVAAYVHELSERHGGSWRRDAAAPAAEPARSG